MTSYAHLRQASTRYVDVEAATYEAAASALARVLHKLTASGASIPSSRPPRPYLDFGRQVATWAPIRGLK